MESGVFRPVCKDGGNSCSPFTPCPEHPTFPVRCKSRWEGIRSTLTCGPRSFPLPASSENWLKKWTAENHTTHFMSMCLCVKLERIELEIAIGLEPRSGLDGYRVSGIVTGARHGRQRPEGHKRRIAHAVMQRPTKMKLAEQKSRRRGVRSGKVCWAPQSPIRRWAKTYTV